MPWQWGTFKGKRVLARVRAHNVFDATDGRVEIRFQLGDTRTYPAHLTNVTLDPKSEVMDPKSEAMEAPSGSRKAVGASPVLEKPWIAYTDGACTGNPGPAGSGLVLCDPGGKIVKESYRYLGRGTNNIAELTAVDMVFGAIPTGAHVLVHTDSKYAIGVLTQGWRAKANAELIATIKKKIAMQPTRLKYVPGHSGVVLNERADELAREAIATRSSSE